MPPMPPCPGPAAAPSPAVMGKQWVRGPCAGPPPTPRNPLCDQGRCRGPSAIDKCHFWTEKKWVEQDVNIELVKPELFQYNQYNYQLFAKPLSMECSDGKAQVAMAGKKGIAAAEAAMSLHPPVRPYDPPTTDIVPLVQTMFVPMLPEMPPPPTPELAEKCRAVTARNPNYEGCCVPVIPLLPGFEGLTPTIKPTPAEICTYGAGCGGELARYPECEPPLRCCVQAGEADDGPMALADTAKQGLGHHGRRDEDGRCPQMPCLDGVDDGSALSVPGGRCMNVKVFNFRARSAKDCVERQETDAERALRLNERFGSYGALPVRPQPRRLCVDKGDSITQQGNGFHWDRPSNPNRLCYSLSRTDRCGYK